MLRRRPLPTPRDRDGRFVNWAGELRSAPVRWQLPATEAAVVALVRRAREDRRTVRVVGAGHSWSAIALPDDVAVSLDQLHRPVDLQLHEGLVTVSAGMRLHDLSAELARHRLALPIVGSIQAQSVGGAIATGTHGSSLVHGNLATLVTGMRLVTGTGDVLDLAADDPRLAGARVHLGALGVVTRVTLRVQPARVLRQEIEHVPIEAVPGLLETAAASAEYVKVWWLPHAPTAQVVRYFATDEAPTRRPTARTQRWFDERILHKALFPAVVATQHRRPGTVAGWNTRMSAAYLGRAVQVGADVLMLNTPMPVRHRETEAAVAISEAGAALTDVIAMFRDGQPAANFPLEIRFVRGDDGWLSPAYGVDTCQIGAYTTNGPDCDSYFEAFWRIMRDARARPHWGKELDHDAAELRQRYPQWDAFAMLRDELDPDRVFGGRFHERMLGD